MDSYGAVYLFAMHRRYLAGDPIFMDWCEWLFVGAVCMVCVCVVRVLRAWLVLREGVPESLKSAERDAALAEHVGHAMLLWVHVGIVAYHQEVPM